MIRDKISNEKIIKILQKQHGNVLAASQSLKVSRNTLNLWIKNDPELKQAQIECRESMIDLAESALIKNIEKGAEASIIFALKTLGRKRGFAERLEISDKSKIADELNNASDEELLQMIENANKRIKDAT